MRRPAVKTITTGQSGDLMTIGELAIRLRVSVGCIRAWRLRGEGPPAVRLGSALQMGCNRSGGMDRFTT